MLGDVLKRNTADDLRNGFGVDPEFAGHVSRDLARRHARPNVSHVLWGQFCVGMSILCGHVSKIVGRSAKEQVRRIAARAIVAAMANHHPIWDRSEGQFVRDAMRAALLAIVLYGSIAGAAVAASPYPASVRSVRLIDANPESFLDRDTLRCHASILPNHEDIS